ncbi:hypothetical protein TNCV_977791 [Trichonephila clavipes]|nr:hypothetical protein TNCV_977791 [Trichonephila clavipes]
MLEKVIENWTSRLDYIRASRGSPMPEIIFKIMAAKENWLEVKETLSPLLKHGERILLSFELSAFGLPLDMSAPRTDVASSIKVGDLFTLEPLSFDANAANDYIEKCTTRSGSKLSARPHRLKKTFRRRSGEVGAKAPTQLHFPRHIGDAESSMEQGETSADESSEEVGIVESVKPVIAPSSPAAKSAGSVSAPGLIEKRRRLYYGRPQW